MAPIHVALALDGRCPQGAAVSMRSIMDNAQSEVGVHFHVVVAPDVRPSDRRALTSTVQGDGGLHEVQLYPFDPRSVAHLQRSRLITHTAYVKPLLGEILPQEVERCVWVDCDLVFDRAIDELWRTDLGACSTGAVLNGSLAERQEHQQRLGLPEPLYFNSGVLLVDLTRWRAQNVAARALDFAERLGDDLILHDQDALNGALQGDWVALPRHWNMWVIHPELRDDAQAVFHYMGSPKPWHPDYDGPHRDRFFRYLDRTAYEGWRPWNPGGFGASLTRIRRKVPFLPGLARAVRARLTRRGAPRPMDGGAP